LPLNPTAARDLSEDDIGLVSGEGSPLNAASYVSSLLGARLSAVHSTGAQTFRAHAALMLTDIEGWTSRVEQLSGGGPDGLDELGRALNRYFTFLAKIVYEHGGDVLGGTGDAFLCCWLADDADGLREASARAAQAAIAFQLASDHRLDPGGRQLSTRIGLAAGELHLAIAGGVNGRWELLPLGAPFAEVAAAERAAPPGGVAVAGSAWRHLAGLADGVEFGDSGLVALTVSPPRKHRIAAPERQLDVSAELLAPFVPAPIRGWRAGTGTQWLAELRRVTVVMISLKDTGGGWASQLERSRLAMETFQEAIARFEGASKPGLDNKGLTLSGVFGLPPRAHEDDPERALRVAVSLKEQLDGTGIPCSVGVASGGVFCGLFGNDLRREYTLSGNVMNLAARLAHAGEHEIICDEPTASMVSDRYRFQALPPIALKGRAEPVAIRRLVGIGAGVPQGHARLVDRDAERAMLAEQLRLLSRRGQRAAIVIEGEAGIGKSALAAEVARLAQASGIRVLVAAADAVERSTGYYAWRPVFASVLGLDVGGPGPQGVERRVRELVGGAPDALRLLPLLSNVLPVAIPDNDFTTEMSGELRADSTTHLLARILARVTKADPVLLLVEDAQWLDSNSWGLLREVLEGVPRLFTLVTTRPIADSAEYEELLAMASRDPVHLGSLSSFHTAELVRRLLGVAELPATLMRFIDDRVAGHPYFCEALVKTMQESGIVQIQRGRAVMGEFESLDVPATVQGAVLSLVDRLTPREQLSLKVAAVVGRTFSVRAVTETYPFSDERDMVAEDLQTLCALDLIETESAETEPAYSFRHEIARDVAYGLLTRSQRRPLHRAVAGWYERNQRDGELERHSALLAHHWRLADEPERAMPYLEQAAQSALRGGAFNEAAQFFAMLRSGSGADAGEPSRVALWEKGEATAHYFLGDLERGRILLEQAVARLDRPVPKGRLQVFVGLLRAVAAQLAHLALPRRYGERRRAEHELLDEAVDCYKILGQINYLTGKSSGELCYLELAGLNLGEEAGPSPELSRALASVAGVISLLNLRSLADRYGARAVRVAELEAHSEALSYVWNVRSLIEAQRGDWPAAIAANDRALELFGEIGDYNLEGELWQTRSALHICRGDFRGAEICWTRTRELAAHDTNPQVESWSLLDEVQTELGRGATAAAGTALEAALAIETSETDGHAEIEKHYSVAGTRLAEGRTEEALAAADGVIEIVARETPTGFHWAEFAAGAAEVYVELLEQAGTPSERAAFEKRAQHACRVLRRSASRFHGIRARRLLLVGRLQWERGRPKRALRAWRRAEALAQQPGMEYDLARARLQIVRHDLAGPRRDALLAAAIETFDELGAIRQLRIAESL
jgi:class 3 adenylate cyclase/tetratricopeptide (TPR) repeat protein